MLLSILCCALPLWAADRVAPENWVALGPGATVEIRDGGLALHHTEARGMVVLPVKGLPFASMKSLRFEIRTDVPTATAVVLGGKKPGGGTYVAAVWSTGDAWQPVVLTPDDFTQTEGTGGLDAGEIENLALLDMNVFTSAGTRNERVYAEPHSGAHTISVRNFEISGEAAPVPAHAAGVIDDFSRPQLAWFTGGGAALSRQDGAMNVVYQQLPEQWIAWTRLVPPGDYAGAARLAMDIQSDRDAQLAISVSERDGSRYNVDFLVAGGKTPEHREVALRAFHTEDGAAGLNPALLRSITFLDVSGEANRNTIRIGNLGLVK